MAVSLLLLSMILAVFSSVRHLGFTTYDERFQLIENPLVRTLSVEHLKEMFTSRNRFGSYYPVRVLSFAVEHALWGLDPKGYHLTNLALHCVNVLLAFYLSCRLIPERSIWAIWTAGIGMGLLAIHPVVVEPVAWVGAREELLMTLGVLASIHLYITTARRHEEKGLGAAVAAGYAAATICGAFACFSSVLGSVTPLLVTAWTLLRPSRRGLPWKRILASTAGLWGLAILTVFLKAYQRTSLNPAVHLEASRPFWDRLALAFSTYGLNLKTLLWPTNLALLYPAHELGSVPAGEILLGAAAGAATILLLWISRRRRVVLFGLVWFLAALSPGSQILPHNFQRMDRLLYLALAGLAIAGGRGLLLLARKKHGILGLGLGCTLLFAAWGMLSVRQVRTWRDGVTVFQQCLRVDPQNAVAMNNLGQAYKRTGQYGLAEKHLWNAVETKPGYFLFRHNLADLYRKQGELGKAAYHYEKAAELLPGYEPPLRQKTLSEEEIRASIERLRETLKADPDDADALDELAWLYATYDVPDGDSRDRAVDWALKACEITNGRDPEMLHTLMTAYAGAGQREKALRTGQEAFLLAREQGNRTLMERIDTFLASFETTAPQNEPLPPQGEK